MTNSKRLLFTGSYVLTKFTPEEQQKAEAESGGAFVKLNLLRAIGLTSDDLERLEQALSESRVAHQSSALKELLTTARRLAASDRPGEGLDTAPLLASVPYAAFDLLTSLLERANPGKASSARRLLRLNSMRRTISPIGRIHLERIEMYPVGVQRGELVFTVPMAPGESVTIAHKEWSASSREFEDVVQDYFESYSERGVAETVDASISSENEAKRTNGLTFGSSLSGSYVGVTLTTTLGITRTGEERESVKRSAQEKRELTEKASARTRKEHKVSVKIVTESGVEEQSGKTITNPAATPIRIDYYRMMRKWRTDLFRYGLRQTYDIAIPAPGVRLWALHQQLAGIEQEIRKPLQFPLEPKDINWTNYDQEARKWGTSVPAPPAESIEEMKHGRIDWLDRKDAVRTRFGQIEFDVPAGYVVASNATLQADFAHWADTNYFLRVIRGGPDTDPDDDVVRSNLAFLAGRYGHLTVVYSYANISMGSIEIRLKYTLTQEARRQWQQTVWQQLRAAAEARHLERVAVLQEQRDTLWRLLHAKDTLTLRRLEREEILRLVMQWLLGPDFPVASEGAVEDLVSRLLQNEVDFQRNPGLSDAARPNPTFAGVREQHWEQAVLFGELVKFIHQAVEWENLIYFLYPYFWGSETVGRGKMLFEHPDPEHERFLRAGYTRVVLPVRPGFEEEFTELLETGALSRLGSSPYVSIAQEIANFARTNYAGVPPANPEEHARPLVFPEQRATWDTMQQAMIDIETFKSTNGRYPTALSELDSGIPVDAWGNPLVYTLPGLGADYDLVSLGADNAEGGTGLNADISSAAGASLVATWFEYTPTSALDIHVDTPLTDLA
nr:type II secretion system protein GspG [Kineosporia babensis]